MSELVKIGSIMVDTGLVLITDPAYIEEAADYLDMASEAVKNNLLGSEVVIDVWGKTSRIGVAFMPGFGDGVYDVMVEYLEHSEPRGKFVKRLVIEFIPDDNRKSRCGERCLKKCDILP